MTWPQQQHDLALRSPKKGKDFKLLKANTIAVRQVLLDARRIPGLLKPPTTSPLTVAQMDAAASQLLKDKHAPANRRRTASGS